MNPFLQIAPQLLSAPEWITPILFLISVGACMLLREGKLAAEGAAWAARLLFAAAVFLAGAVMLAGSMRIELAAWGPAKLALLIDPLSVLMLTLVSFLGLIVTRYSINYLAGDPEQARFSRWLVITLCSVLVLVISSNQRSNFFEILTFAV